jgi:hypothetical protein
MALVVGITTAVMAAGTPFAHASPSASEDGQDTFNVAKGTAVSATSSKVVISVPLASLLITCTASSLAGRTGTSLTFSIGLPTFNDGSSKSCNDNLGFTDTFKSSTLNGAWTLTEKDFTNGGAGDEGLTEPNATGDRMVIRLPKAGLTDQNNWPCSIIFAPSATASISGTYNDAGMFVVKGAKVPVSVSGPSFCGPTSQTATITGTYRLTPGIFDRG